jgi:hypothetical protein
MNVSKVLLLRQQLLQQNTAHPSCLSRDLWRQQRKNSLRWSRLLPWCPVPLHGALTDSLAQANGRVLDLCFDDSSPSPRHHILLVTSGL